MAALAAVMGVIDVFGDQRICQLTTVRWHASASVLLVLVKLFNLAIRYQQGAAAIVLNRLLLSLVLRGPRSGEAVRSIPAADGLSRGPMASQLGNYLRFGGSRDKFFDASSST